MIEYRKGVHRRQYNAWKEEYCERKGRKKQVTYLKEKHSEVKKTEKKRKVEEYVLDIVEDKEEKSIYQRKEIIKEILVREIQRRKI